MPTPEEVAPLASHLLDDEAAWCSGHVIFAAGSELAVIEPSSLLEVVRCEPAGAPDVLAAVGGPSLVRAHEGQVSTGGAGPRFAGLFDSLHDRPGPPADETATPGGTCGVVGDNGNRIAGIRAALADRGVEAAVFEANAKPLGFVEASRVLEELDERSGPLGSLIVWLGRPSSQATRPDWQAVLDNHDGIAERILGDAAFARAVADHAARTGRPMRLVTMIDEYNGAGRTRAQASAQLARSAEPATAGLVAAFTVGVGTAADPETAAHLAAYLACHPDAAGLTGAELVVGAGWLGLRSHPRVATSIVYGGPEVPAWLGGALREAVAGIGRGA